MLFRNLLIFTLFLPLVFTGCALSTASLDDLDDPLSVIKKAVEDSLPLGVRKVSRNGRTFFSNYYLIARGKYVRAATFKTRYYAKVTILGDGRPYDVNIDVYKELKVGRSDGVTLDYQYQGSDERQANRLARRISKKLTKRRKDLNIIDDFRVF